MIIILLVAWVWNQKKPQVKVNYICKYRSLWLIKFIINPNIFKQVLLNFIRNYVRYSDKDSYIILNLHQQNNEAVIHVCEQAKGISLSQ